jgi:hypothetical protein
MILLRNHVFISCASFKSHSRQGGSRGYGDGNTVSYFASSGGVHYASAELSVSHQTRSLNSNQMKEFIMLSVFVPLAIFCHHLIHEK